MSAGTSGTTPSLTAGLAWFGAVLGAVELAAPSTLIGLLGLPVSPGFVRAFGLREIGAGAVTLGRPHAIAGPVLRLGGDALDLAVLGAALGPRNERRGAAAIGFALVLGIAVLDAIAVARAD